MRKIKFNVEDLCQAEREIVKIVQRDSFEDELKVLQSRKDANSPETHLRKSSPLFCLDPFLDDNGVLRVGGRLSKSDLPYEQKHPIILPRKGHVISLIIRYFHEQVRHQGRGLTANEILGCSSSVASAISKCVLCRKIRSKTEGQKMADLPPDRTKAAPPSHTAPLTFLALSISRRAEKN